MKDEVKDRPKRHCMVVHAFYPLAETRVQREAEALTARGYEVDVICLRLPRQPAEERHNGIQIYRLPVKLVDKGSMIAQLLNYLRFFILAAMKLTRLHLGRRYDSIQVHNLPDFLVFCALIPKLQGVPVILDLHDLMPEFFMARSSLTRDHWQVRLIALQEKISCRFADYVITVTELWRQSLIERGVPAHKVGVVMNTADETIFNRNGLTPKAAKNNGSFHIFYHGTQVYRYGVDLILQAVARIRDKIPGLHLTIHGNGDYTSTLIQLSEQLNLGDSVKFSTSFVALEKLVEMIRTADISIVPYRRDIFTDGILPTKLMEYVAIGVPVIVARTPVIEAYFDETMVEYFTSENIDELVDSILKLYNEPERRLTLVENSDRFNQTYNWTNLSTDYVQLVNRLTSRN